MVHSAQTRTGKNGERELPVEPSMLRVSDLKRYFDVSAPFLNRLIERQPVQILKAVDGVSFQIKKGETLLLPAAAAEVMVNTSESRFLKVSL